MANFTDNFNRADENLEASANWTRVDGAAGALQVSSNMLGSFSTTETAYQCPDCAVAGQFVQATNKDGTGSNHGFLALRVTDANNFVGARVSGAIYQVFQRVAGTFTQLGTDVGAQNAGDVMLLTISSGNSLDFSVNGSALLTGLSVSGSLTSTRAGFIQRSANLNPLFDDFSATGAASGPSIPVLMNSYRQRRN